MVVKPKEVCSIVSCVAHAFAGFPKFPVTFIMLRRCCPPLCEANRPDPDLLLFIVVAQLHFEPTTRNQCHNSQLASSKLFLSIHAHPLQAAVNTDPKKAKKDPVPKAPSINNPSSKSNKLAEVETNKVSTVQTKDKKEANKEDVSAGKKLAKESKPARARSAFIFFT